MKSKRILEIILLLLGMGILCYILTILILGDDAVKLFADNFIAITSLAISLVALVITLITYIAIDSVNEVTSMEGNVLENPNYTISSGKLIDDFKGAKDEIKFSELLMNKLDKETKNNKSCIELADSIQAVVDHLIWFAYTDSSNEFVKKMSKDIIERIDKSYEKFSKVSNAVKYAFHENLELIKYVMKYQKSAKESTEYKSCELVNIKGKMIQNPISKIVYYDYLGLDYRRSAAQCLNALVPGEKAKEFSLENMRKLKENAKSQDLTKAKFLLEEAKEAFEKAVEYAEGDILWDGYVSYNLARVSVMYYLIEPEKYDKQKVLEDIEKAVYARKKVLNIYDVGNGYICNRLKDELARAEVLLENVKQV